MPEAYKIDFKFKKRGFKRLLIFDLDETLIHSKCDEEDYDDDELLAMYGDFVYNLEPDEWVDLINPDTQEQMK